MKPEANNLLQTALKYLNIVHEDEGTLNAEEIKFSVGEGCDACCIYISLPGGPFWGFCGYFLPKN